MQDYCENCYEKITGGVVSIAEIKGVKKPFHDIDCGTGTCPGAQNSCLVKYSIKKKTALIADTIEFSEFEKMVQENSQKPLQK